MSGVRTTTPAIRSRAARISSSGSALCTAISPPRTCAMGETPLCRMRVEDHVALDPGAVTLCARRGGAALPTLCQVVSRPPPEIGKLPLNYTLHILAPPLPRKARLQAKIPDLAYKHENGHRLEITPPKRASLQIAREKRLP